MAIDANIEFEDEDNDEVLDRLKKHKTDSSKDAPRPQTTGIEEDQVAPPSTRDFTPKQKDKQQEKEVNKANRAANRRRREEMADRKRALREEQQDKERARRADLKARKQASKDQVLQSRTEAISDRIGIYSLASSLGLQGYVAASIVDNLYLRPKEKAETSQQENYQRQLERYNETLKSDAIQQQRATEQAIRNTPVPATPIGPTGAPLPPGSFPPVPPVPPVPPPIPPNPQPNPTPPPPIPPNPNPPPNPPPPTPPIPPNPPVPPVPPPIPPTPPIPPAPTPFSQLAGKANLVAGLIQGVQALNRGISTSASNATSIGTNIASNNAIQGSQAVLGGLKSTIGFNTSALVVVEGFNSLLSINQSILDSIKGDLGFAPQTLQANVQSDILKLSRQIESAQRLDKVTAELIRANTTLDEAWNGLRTEFLEDLGPYLVTVLNFISTNIKAITTLLDFVSGVVEGAAFVPGSIGQILSILKAMFDLMYKDNLDKLDDADIMKQIDNFFNVELTAGKLPKGANPF